MTAENSPRKTAKPRGKPFKPGESGNPAGKPPGTRNATTRALEAMLDGEAETLTRKVIELALAGDLSALRLCIDRILPARKDRPVSIDMPIIKTTADVLLASSAIVAAMARGDITPSEASELSKVIDVHARVVEVHDLSGRLAALEAKTR